MIKDILSKFPKERPPLSQAHKERFKLDYKTNRDGTSGIIGKAANQMETWMHRKVVDSSVIGNTLEVGAGTLNHLRFENLSQPYDVVEPFIALYSDKHEEKLSIRNFYNSLSEIPKNQKYGRVISIATLEHMTSLPQELERISKVLIPNGVFQAAIPTEGGLLWGLSWRLTTALSYKIRTGLSYSTIMKHEHVNEADEIVALIRYYFKDVIIERFPINTKHFSFYTYISARK